MLCFIIVKVINTLLYFTGHYCSVLIKKYLIPLDKLTQENVQFILLFLRCIQSLSDYFKVLKIL